MRNEWTIICEATAFDQTTHRPSLFNCISEGRVEKFSKKMPPVHIVSTWFFEAAGEYEFSMELILPDRTVQQLGKPVKYTLPAGSAVFDMGGVVLQFSQYGVHLLRMSCRQGEQVTLGQEARLLIVDPAQASSSAGAQAPIPDGASKPARKAPKAK